MTIIANGGITQNNTNVRFQLINHNNIKLPINYTAFFRSIDIESFAPLLITEISEDNLDISSPDLLVSKNSISLEIKLL